MGSCNSTQVQTPLQMIGGGNSVLPIPASSVVFWNDKCVGIKNGNNYNWYNKTDSAEVTCGGTPINIITLAVNPIRYKFHTTADAPGMCTAPKGAVDVSPFGAPIVPFGGPDPNPSAPWNSQNTLQKPLINSNDTIAQAWCIGAARAYGIVPYQTWGSLTNGNVQGWWDSFDCNSYVSYWVYGVRPWVTWGSLSGGGQSAWTRREDCIAFGAAFQINAYTSPADNLGTVADIWHDPFVGRFLGPWMYNNCDCLINQQRMGYLNSAGFNGPSSCCHQNTGKNGGWICDESSSWSWLIGMNTAGQAPNCNSGSNTYPACEAALPLNIAGSIAAYN